MKRTELVAAAVAFANAAKEGLAATRSRAEHDALTVARAAALDAAAEMIVSLRALPTADYDDEAF